MGLAVAVLADRAKNEKIAKSLIFMPLAISLVGASVIWRFMYVPRDASVEQTGLMNALWVGLGRLSTGSGLPTIIVGVVAAIALAVAAGERRPGARPAQLRQGRRSPAIAADPRRLVLHPLHRLGRRRVRRRTTDGETVPNPVSFIQESPFNNVWLMVILIWIQTGFAMVILSAAIKAVPDEIIEAARVDGATTSQIFWRVTLPQIATDDRRRRHHAHRRS